MDEAKASQPDAYDRVMESWAIESTYNSNNIEGSALSLGDTALLFDGMQVKGPADDIRQVEGGFAALRFLRAAVYGREPLTETLVKRAHELVFAEAKDPATRGVYRTVEVEVTGMSFQPIPSAYVPEQMAELVAMCAKTKRQRPHGQTRKQLLAHERRLRASEYTGRIEGALHRRDTGFPGKRRPVPFAVFFCLNLAERLEKVLSLLTTDNTGVAARGHSDIGNFLHESDDPEKNLTIDTQEPDD